jgi:lipopolysaccharide/colanic/teichoic acid biosynthesis glycosyltransferase
MQRAIKSALDRIIAAVSLLVLLPVFAIVAVAVLVSSRGPVFYLQTRIGHKGTPFRMVKFRSMRPDADSLIDELRADNDADDGLLFKLRADPRVTGVGRFLRKYSLDELPQLVNVLTGSMSLVGPRPALPVEVEQYDSRVRRRLLVKPGLTGSWQVAGRSDLPWDEAVRLDLNYVDEWSLGLDLRILARTPGAVLRATGAY